MKVFLSHAVIDKRIADILCTLLGDGLNVTRKDIFCSSLPGQKIPGGFNFVGHIKNELERVDTVICLLSQNYLDSQFCLAELGACWILSKKVIPLIVPPLTYSDINATLSLTQAWKIADIDDLNSFAKDLQEKADVAQWGVAARKFLKIIPDIIKKQPAPGRVSFKEYSELKCELEYAETKIAQDTETIKSLNSEIKELKKCKDKNDVAKIERTFSSEEKQFNALCDSAESALDQLPRIAAEALYYEMKDESFPPPNPFDDNRKEDLASAVDRNFIIVRDDEPIVVNEAHPKIGQAKEKLAELRYFMDRVSPEFIEKKESENSFTFSLKNKDFWERYLY